MTCLESDRKAMLPRKGLRSALGFIVELVVRHQPLDVPVETHVAVNLNLPKVLQITSTALYGRLEIFVPQAPRRRLLAESVELAQRPRKSVSLARVHGGQGAPPSDILLQYEEGRSVASGFLDTSWVTGEVDRPILRAFKSLSILVGVARHAVLPSAAIVRTCAASTGSDPH